MEKQKAQETGDILTCNQRAAVPGWVAAALGMVAALVATGCASEDVTPTPGGEMDTLGDSNDVVVIANGDFNGDGNTDFGYFTKSDEGYLATELLNNGAGAYDVRTSDQSTKTVDLAAVNWIERDTGDINELTATVPGLATAVNLLNPKQRASLGLKGDEGTARNYYDCPGNWMCFWEHTYFEGWMFGTSPGTDVDWVGDWANDRFSSYRNDTWNQTNVFEHAGYTGQTGPIYAKTNDNSIHDWMVHQCWTEAGGIWYQTFSPCCDCQYYGHCRQGPQWYNRGFGDCISSYNN